MITSELSQLINSKDLSSQIYLSKVMMGYMIYMIFHGKGGHLSMKNDISANCNNLVETGN